MTHPAPDPREYSDPKVPTNEEFDAALDPANNGPTKWYPELGMPRPDPPLMIDRMKVATAIVEARTLTRVVRPRTPTDNVTNPI